MGTTGTTGRDPGPAGGEPAFDDRHWALRTEVYRHFARTTRAPSFAELGAATGVPTEEVGRLLEELEARHHLALLPDRSGVWMAHPFSATSTAFPVDTERGRFWANCAWDALGVPAILGLDGWTETRCAASGEPIAFGVRDGRVAGDAAVLERAVIHLLVPPRNAWDDIGFT